jgi:hypothetical protein
MVIPRSLDGTGKIYGLRRMRRNDRRRMRRKRRRRRKRMMDLLDTRERGGYLVLRIMGSMNGRSRRWRLYWARLGVLWVSHFFLSLNKRLQTVMYSTRFLEAEDLANNFLFNVSYF